jgi:hypothetical protein
MRKKYMIALVVLTILTLHVIAQNSRSAPAVTWTVVNDTPFSADYPISCVTYGRNMFVAGNWVGELAWSEDGVKWEPVRSSGFGGNAIRGVVYGGGVWGL